METPLTQPLFESKPRWPGGPPICVAANLPAFATETAMKEFIEANAPGILTALKWKCLKCGHWHFWGVDPGPSGVTSGSARGVKYLPHSVAKLKRGYAGKTMQA